MNLNELSRQVHKNAVEHGWWDEERSFGYIISLCHSELSEALEEYRNGKGLNEIYFKCPGCGSPNEDYCDKCKDRKPEGIPVELADCIIRILDYTGREDIDIDFLVITTPDVYRIDTKDLSFGDFLAEAHNYLSLSFKDLYDEYAHYRNVQLANCAHR